MDYTPILKLSLPPFDDVPWDEAINSNSSILDAAVGQFFGIANMTGLWKNATAYAVGQSVVDSSDSSVWTCAVSNTSAASGTFNDERIANPGYWIEVASGAQTYAEQAAISASQAATSAAAAAAAVSGSLPLSGGTLTGSLTLSSAPTVALHAATKAYADTKQSTTGVTNGSNAAAGAIGEYRSASLASGSAVPLTTNTAINILALSLSAGDWDITGAATFISTTDISAVQAWTSPVSATVPTTGSIGYTIFVGNIGSGSAFPTGAMRLNVSVPTTVYLTVFASFLAGNAVSAFGSIGARRRR